jgi:protein tyrosine/serine phosphatase
LTALWRAAATWLIGSTLLMMTACNGSAPTPDADACASRTTSPIVNFCVVAANTLWRGGKPDAAGAVWLIDNGVKTVVNLELINDDLSTLTSAKVSSTTSTSINYFRIRNFEPVVALAPALQDAQVAQFLAVMATAPKPAYVHCRSGQNRTGVNVAAYRVLIEGVPVEAAIAEMGKYQGIWFKFDADYIRSIDTIRKAAILASAAALASSTKPLAVVKCANGGCS